MKFKDKPLEYINSIGAVNIEVTNFYLDRYTDDGVYIEKALTGTTYLISTMIYNFEDKKRIVKHFRDYNSFFDYIIDVNLNIAKATNKKMLWFAHEFNFVYDWLYKNSEEIMRPAVKIRKDGSSELYWLAIENHKVIMLHPRGLKNIEFRCSKKLTDSGIDELANKFKIDIPKINKNIERFYDTPLDIEYKYSESKLSVIISAVLDTMNIKNHSIETLPTTFTGLGRAEFYRFANSTPNNKKLLSIMKADCKNELPKSNEEMKLLNDCFSGGYCHANYKYVDRIIENVLSYDISSAYPHQMISKTFPRDFKYLPEEGGANDFFKKYWIISDNNKYKVIRGNYFVARILFKDLKAKTEHTIIPLNKIGASLEIDIDNGRIRSAKMLELVVTDVFFKDIMKFYGFSDIVCIELLFSNHASHLPTLLVKFIKLLIDKKQRLKNELREIKNNIENSDSNIKTQKLKKEYSRKEREYEHIKVTLNSQYGINVQKLRMPLVELKRLYEDDKGNIKLKSDNENDIEIGELYWDTNNEMTSEIIGDKSVIYDINDINNIKGHTKGITRAYQWGIYITDYARHQLLDVMYELESKGIAHCIYADTDSISCVPTHNSSEEEIKKYFENYNKKLSNSYNGIGQFEPKEKALFFKTLGSKKYAYINQNKDIIFKVSGLPGKNINNFIQTKYNNKVEKVQIMLEKLNKKFDDISDSELEIKIELLDEMLSEDFTFPAEVVGENTICYDSKRPSHIIYKGHELKDKQGAVISCSPFSFRGR